MNKYPIPHPCNDCQIHQRLVTNYTESRIADTGKNNPKCLNCQDVKDYAAAISSNGYRVPPSHNDTDNTPHGYRVFHEAADFEMAHYDLIRGEYRT